MAREAKLFTSSSGSAHTLTEHPYPVLYNYSNDAYSGSWFGVTRPVLKQENWAFSEIAILFSSATRRYV